MCRNTMPVKQVTIPIIAVLCVLALSQTTSSSSQCPSSTPVKFSLSSRRNQTGHWITQVHLEHGANYLSNDRWDVSVEQDTNCGPEAVGILATVTGPSSFPTLVVPGQGYQLIQGIGYYKFHTMTVPWDEGRKICAMEGAHLAIINSQEEANALQQLFQDHPHIPNTENSNAVSIGFHDRFTEGEYLTLFGDTLAKAGFAKWSTLNHQPDNSGGNENCGSMHRDGALNDIGCGVRIPFICEFEAPIPTIDVRHFIADDVTPQ